MGFDAMANDAPAVPAIGREIGKKKRANRSAKLKQCKLDARREQWLSQVKNKECKDASRANTPTSPPQQISEGRSAEREHRCRGADLEHDGLNLHDSSDAESPTRNPNGNPGRKESPTNNSISSSGSSIGSCSSSVSDAEEDDEVETGEKGGGGLDDWEAVADALVSPDNGQDYHPKSADSQAATAAHSTSATTRSPEPMKWESDRTIPRAWRPDDVFRPQSLPNLLKQRSFSVNMERRYDAHHNHHGILSPPPSSCPICYEDLDLTDSSFLPCSCGFRLCLFCHKRILEADGRCPGCRKQYTPVTGGTEIGVIAGVGVPPLPYRLSRSVSMVSRS